MNYLYIIILFVLIPVIPVVKKVYYVIYNRLFLQNRNIQDKLKPMVQQALRENNLGRFTPSEYTEIKLVKLDDKTDLILAELFVIDKGDWNVVERLVKITGIKVADKFYIKTFQDENSRDLGTMIPANSSIPQNRLFRSRRWGNHQNPTNWNEYKKDWDISWMNEDI